MPKDRIFSTARANDAASKVVSVPAVREKRDPLSILAVSGALLISATSAAEPLHASPERYLLYPPTSGSGVEHRSAVRSAFRTQPTTREAITELRRTSGLTWELLGQLFDVSRRSVHFWASGKPLSATNEQKLLQTLDVVRCAYRGDARSTRAALLQPTDGVTAFELLRQGEFDSAREMLGEGGGQRRPALQDLSSQAKLERMPSTPDKLMDAKHDRIHRESSGGRAARTVRNTERGSS